MAWRWAAGMRAVVALLVVLLAPLAAASLTEQATGVDLQRDGGAFGDAPDSCQTSRGVSFPVLTGGMLAPGDDLRDFYHFAVPADRVGTPVELRADAGVDVDLYVYSAGCADYYDSSRSYTGHELIRFVPVAAGTHIVQVRLHSPLSDSVAPGSTSLVGYELALR